MLVDPPMKINATTFTNDGYVRLNEFLKVTIKVTYSSTFVGEDDEGYPEDQDAFIGKLGTFYREKAMEYKPPRFNGHQLNCLK